MGVEDQIQSIASRFNLWNWIFLIIDFLNTYFFSGGKFAAFKAIIKNNKAKKLCLHLYAQ